jgi:tRNA pseudouridine55 synthase
MTSHDVVSWVRRLAQMRRVGHAGTLDPLATGVLLVCLGSATRVSEFLMHSTKVYRGTIRFGARSTTDDAEGELSPVPLPAKLGRDEIEAATATLVGEVEQVPPAFSAVKVAGKPLYERARAGEEVEPSPRRVQIDRIEVLTWTPPDVVVEVVCGKGTYIRSIARDLGLALRTGAHLVKLIRLACGRFCLEDSVSLEEVDRAAAARHLDRLLYPIDAALTDWPTVVLTDRERDRIAHGSALASTLPLSGKRVRAYGADGRLVAILEYRDEPAGWYPGKVFGLGETHGVA